MRVKRYVVDDLPEAVQLIRNELGSDAVILGTKEIRQGGFLGMFRKRRVEVIAAVDDAALARTKASSGLSGLSRPLSANRTHGLSAAGSLGGGQESDATAAASDPAGTVERVVPLPPQVVRERYARQPLPTVRTGETEAAARPGGGEPPAQAAATGRAGGWPNGSGAVRPSAATGVSAAGPANGTAILAADPEASGELLRELRAVKDMVVQMARQQTFGNLPEPIAHWTRRLAEQGVEPALVEQFAEEMERRLGRNREAADDNGYATAKEILLEWLAPYAGKGISPDTRIVRLVGPTGVGKTTTLAKLAAEQTLTYRRSVGFITADTYRIAAVDQLRTYADILDVPLEVVFSPSELIRAYNRLADRDLLLMDTAGRNYRNELFVSEVNSLLSAGERARTYLVLSMTHKYADMRLVASHFAKYGVNSLLLTKFDETDSYGAVLNLVHEFGFEISYITCGQTVPDDIRVFDPEELVRKMLGESAHA